MSSQTPARAFQARKCSNPRCQLRFPVDAGSDLGAQCPLCGQATERLEAQWSTHAAPSSAPHDAPHVSGLLDNIRSLRNVGGIFRTADGAGFSHLHLCGFTPTPAHPKLAKTALGAELHVPWTRHMDAVDAARALREDGQRLWALEGGSSSENLFDATRELQATDHVVVIVGHEVSGVDPRVLEVCERSVAIPMAGVKGSLNVGTAFGIAAYALRYRLAPPATSPAR